ncbi:MAG: AAA family ATPase [Bacteroidota bacterium]
MSDKNDALGGNYKFATLKTFGSKENLHQNVKKYRRVFDVAESRYIYAEMAFYNKLFDEKEWKTEVKLICVNVDTKKQVCELKKEITISSDKNMIYVREGWGTPDPGWWKRGVYRWDAYIGDNFVGNITFYVVNNGLVTSEHNPYFDITSLKMFESPRNGMAFDQREYLSTFPGTTTRYVNIEMTLANKLTQEDNLPLEFHFNFYNDASQLKAVMTYFRNFTDKRQQIILDTGYGSDTSGFWYEDNYSLEIIFMDQLIAVVPFRVGKEKELMSETGANYSTNTLRTPTGPEAEEEQKITFEDAKQELEDLIGLHAVKTQINELATYLQFIKIRQEKGFTDSDKMSLHTVFMGNPGTGKTTVARMLGKIYTSLDLLSHGRVFEVGRADLVGEFIGQTAPKVKKAIEQARGGILFIDEAYALTDRGDDKKDFGKEVIEVLLKELSDGKGDIAIVFAGYPEEMQSFLDANPGLASRLPNVISFPDYSPDELMDIAEYSAGKKDVTIEGDAKILIKNKVVEAYRNRNRKFGNARFVNGIIEEAKQNMALRLMRENSNFDEVPKEVLSTITHADVEKVFIKDANKGVDLPVDEPLYKDAMTQLNQLIGLDNVKKEVEEMAKLVRYYREIGKDIRRSFSLHGVFKGNPGTGKTTVARLLVQIYKALGILERGHLVEVARKDLVAGYVGQTAMKTSKVIDEAIGGGLFIDEAYALSERGQNDFGKEVIETLLKRMEDQRGEFMIIVAGYPEEMQAFLEANPGLLSRFDRQFHFKDYSVDELYEIGEMIIRMEDMKITDKAWDHLKSYIKKLVDNKHKYFGNARTVRKIVTEAIRRQHLRMADLPAKKRTEEVIQTISIEDVSDFELMEQRVKQKTIGFGRNES